MLTAKAAIQIIRDQVRTVREKGGSLITAESLGQLLDHLDSGQVDRDIGLIIASQQEAALARYRARADSLLELFKSVIQSGQAALKSFFLLNGGAAVAVLALIGHLSTSSITAAQVNKFGRPLLSFACGLAFTTLASGLTYLVQKAYSPPKKNRRLAERLNALVILMCAASLVAFIVGCGFAYGAIQAIAASSTR